MKSSKMNQMGQLSKIKRNLLKINRLEVWIRDHLALFVENRRRKHTG